MAIMENIYAEHELRELSRNLVSIVLWKAPSLDPDTLQDQYHILEKLLRTAEHSWTTGTHVAKVCDALCGFLGLCNTAASPQLQGICRKLEILHRTLAFYISRAGDSKAKPMRHVLKTLLKLISNGPEGNTEAYKDVSKFIQVAVLQCLKNMFPIESSSQAKASMMVLEAFLTTHIIEVSDIIYRINCSIVGANYKATIDKVNFWVELEPARSVSSETLHVSFEILIAQVLYWVGFADVTPAAGRFLTSLFQALENGDRVKLELAQFPSLSSFWVIPLRKILQEEPEIMEAVTHHILPPLLRMNASGMGYLFNSLSYRNLVERDYGSIEEADIRLCLSVLTIAEDMAMSESLNYSVVEGKRMDHASFVETLCSGLLLHESSNIRIAALATLIHSSSSTRPCTAKTFVLLRRNLPFFYAEHDPKIRAEFISLMKYLCSRLQASVTKMLRSQAMHDKSSTPVGMAVDKVHEDYEEDCSEILESHLSFIEWHLEMVITKLRATASYQPHIMALKVLQHTKNFGLEHRISAGCPSSPSLRVQARSIAPIILRLLLDLTMDPFDDVRDTAAAILKGMISSGSVVTKTEFDEDKRSIPTEADLRLGMMLHTDLFDQTISNAEVMVNRTGRADYADGLGRLYELKCDYLVKEASSNKAEDKSVSAVLELVESLESRVESMKNSIHVPSSGVPLHGLLVALRYITCRPDYVSLWNRDGSNSNVWRNTHERLFECCESVWKVVKDILCVDSPEGHVSEDSEDNETEVDAKDLLSFSWRALREASSLMLAMITNPGYSPLKPEDGLSYADFRRLGDLAFTQLAELRHRGAFSTVSQTFLACCSRCARSSDAMIASLPKHWYNETLLCIEERASTLTRRSAGLPAMITGVLAAYENGPELKGFISELQTIASATVVRNLDENAQRLPQVHALNCLKDVFTTSQLGAGTEPYIGTTLQIAMDSIQHDVWAIRNCSLMLLKALFTRLAGGNSSLSSSVETRKHDDLLNLALEVFANQRNAGPGQSDSSHVILPAIQLIERLNPQTSRQQDNFRNWLVRLLGDKSWILREKAARAMVALEFRYPTQLIEDLQTRDSSKSLSTNALHGRLLCIDYMFEGYKYVPEIAVKAHDWLRLEFDVLAAPKQCPTITATYFSILCSVVGLLAYRKSTWPLILEHRAWWLARMDAQWKSILQTKKRILHRTFFTDLLIRELVSADVLLRDLENHVDSEVKWAGTSTFVVDLLPRQDFAIAFILEGLEHTSRKTSIDLRLPIPIYLTILEHSYDYSTKILAVEHLIEIVKKSGFDPQWYRQARIENSQPLHPYLNRVLSGSRTLERGGVIPPAKFTNGALELRGMVLAHDYVEHKGFELVIKSWIRAVRFASNEKSELLERKAALRSLYSFRTAMRQQDSMASRSPVMIGMYIALYDMLNDDDEVIRQDAASIVSWIFSRPSSSPGTADKGNLSLMPLAATCEILNFLGYSYRDSVTLCVEAILRLTGSSSTNGTRIVEDVAAIMEEKLSREMKLIPLRELLGQAGKEDNALFVEERQNLFIDDVREAERWADILKVLSHSAVEKFAPAFEEWVLEGLSALLDSAKEIDGPLGWTSKPEVFALGMRVIIAARVLLDWIDEGYSRIRKEEVRRFLEQLVEIGGRTGLHGLWIRRANLVLK